MGGPWGQSEPGGRVQCSLLWCTTLRSVAASRLHIEGREISSNTIGIPHTERHRWTDGRGVPAIWFGFFIFIFLYHFIDLWAEPMMVVTYIVSVYY